jgi:uncharacterized protein YabE (DUF348 family)
MSSILAAWLSWRVRAVGAGIVVLGLAAGGGTSALIDAHKTVTLDVDGTVTTVSTFAGSVAGLLDAAGVRLGAHDVVTPSADAPLAEGANVVVRFGHEITLEENGEQIDVWVAATDAQEALDLIAARGMNVSLVVSRSGERAALPLRLAGNGELVAVVADGHRTLVADTGGGVDEVLASANVTLGTQDIVTVQEAADGRSEVEVVVQRVATHIELNRMTFPFAQVTQDDPERFTDAAPEIVQPGVAGETVVTERVTTIDGVETERVQVSVTTTPPVDEVTVVGSKPRPAPPPPRPPVNQAAPPSSVPGDVWTLLANCEAGGRPNAVSANGLYYGMYQFSLSTWASVGGTGLPSEASPEEQTMRAQMLQARSGWGQWPACARSLGLL